ncbi:MAG: T9SS type A sorting domain-containing protein [Lentimicrobium sp.]|nr:T9SS type A sorting domain-containing protein [Lentimicrobium sp.]
MKRLLFILLIFCHNSYAFSQPIVLEWQACFGTTIKEVAYDICATGDGYIIAAERESNSLGSDIILIRTDLYGNLVWQKFVGGTSSDVPYRIFPAGNDCYYISAISASEDGDISYNPYPEGYVNFWLFKINGSGDIIWDKMYGGTCFDQGWTACHTHDGGMVSLGYTCSDDGDISNYFGSWDTWLLRTDSLGNKVWDFTIGTEFLDFPNAIIQTSDRGFLVASGSMPTTGGNITCQPFDLETSDIVLFKIDSMANIEWQRCIGGSSDEVLADILEIEDGYMLAAAVSAADGDMTGSGYHYGTTPTGHPTSDIWLAKIDFEGNVLWQKCYGGTARDIPNSIFPTPNGGYIIIGETESNDGDVSGKHNVHGQFSDIWVFKINATGDLLWQKCFGGLGYERLTWSGVIDNGDGSYVITATIFNNSNSGDLTCLTTPPGGYDIWLIQLRDTTVVSSNHMPKPEYAVKAYPNPANEYVVFELQKPLPSGKITISDITGREIAVMSTTGEKTVWQTKGVRPGVYVYKLQSQVGFGSGKLLISP